MNRMDYNLVVILGPTASGKTRLGVRLAKERGSAVISADSRQVYRSMNIGTGKDLDEYLFDGVAIPYHMIDIVDPREEFNVFEFQRQFYHCHSRLTARGIVPVMVGGAGLYIDSVLRGYEMKPVSEDQSLRAELAKEDDDALTRRLLTLSPRLHNTTDLGDRKRLIRAIEIAEFTGKSRDEEKRPMPPQVVPLVIGVHWDRASLRQRITRRLQERLAAGMIDEVQGLHDAGISWERMDSFGLEYRYVSFYLRGMFDEKEMFLKLNTRIHQFAKRQMTWFRRMEKQGIPIHWIEGDDYGTLKSITDQALS
jgi:tRNA dimethylallyltransferase